LIGPLQCEAELEAEHVECDVVGDGCGAKVVLKVVSKKFDGVPLLKRHKMVNQMLSEELSSNKIHALTIKAWTPAQYEAKK
jgi:stress-induced morphogen